MVLVAFSDGLLSLRDAYLRFLQVFSWLHSSYLYSTPYYSPVRIHHSLSLHLLTGILVAKRFGNDDENFYKHLCAGFCMDSF